ncbi:MAG: hypothetical protein JSV39_03685 [Candidatus Aenigmatarchaeota archaeon]|nr:MAG: hypothetical protein JSV39_03685 [Candidatus Aenigmarchaeota archaeon]
MAKEMGSKGINNLEIDKKGGYLIVSINPKIYPLEVIYSAAYVFLDKAYLIIDGNPKEEIFVQMKPKEGKKVLEELGNEFNNELVNYSVYVVQAVRNQPLRKAIIERVLLTNIKEIEHCPECGCRLEVCEDCGKNYCPSCESDENVKNCLKCGTKLEICPDCGEKYCPKCEPIDKSKHDKGEPPKEEEFKEEDFVVGDPLGIAKPWKPAEGREDEESKGKQKKG